MMNKRGQLAGLIFPLITLVLVVVSLFTFVSFNDKFASDSEGRNKIIVSIAFYENYVIKESGIIAREAISSDEFVDDENLKAGFKEIAEKNNFGIVGLEGYFEKIENGDFSFSKQNGGYLFEIDNLLLQYSNGANSFKRNLNFRIVFDLNGDVLRVEKSAS